MAYTSRFSTFTTLYVIIIVLVVESLTCGAQDFPTVKIGVLRSKSGMYAFAGKATQDVADFWSLEFKSHGIGQTGIVPIIEYCDVASDYNLSAQCAKKLINNGSTVLIAPEGPNAVSAALVAEQYKVPMMAVWSSLQSIYICDERLLTPCTQPDMRRFQYLIGSQPVGADVLRDYIPSVRVQGAKSVSALMAPDEYNVEVCSSGINLAKSLGMVVNIVNTLPVNFTSADILHNVGQLQSADSDVVLVCARPTCTAVNDAFNQLQYTPKSLFMLLCITSPLPYVVDFGVWDERLSGTMYQDDHKRSYCNRFVDPTSTTPSPKMFSNQFQAYANYKPTTQSAVIMATFYMIEAAIAIGNSSTAESIHKLLHQVYLRSFYGVTNVDFYGLIRSTPILLIQNQPITTVSSVSSINSIVSPVTVQTSAFIYPIPTIQERQDPEVRLLQITNGSLVVLLAIFSCIWYCLLGWATIRCRQHPSIRASSWKFGLIAIAGAIMLSLATLSWTPQDNSSNCKARIPLLLHGCALLICPILMKLLRIYKIFHKDRLQVSKLRDYRMGVIMVGSWLPWWILLMIWLIANPLQLQLYTPDALRPHFNFYQCEMSNDGTPYYVLFGLMVVFYLAILSFFAFKTSSEGELYSQAKVLLWTIYTWTFCIVLVCVVQATNGPTTSRTSMFLIRSVGFIVSTWIYTTMLLGVPLYNVWSGNAYVAKYTTQDDQNNSAIDNNQPARKNSATKHTKYAVKTAKVSPSPPSVKIDVGQPSSHILLSQRSSSSSPQSMPTTNKIPQYK